MSKNNISIEVIDNFEGTEIFDYKALEERVNFLSDSIRSSDLIPDEEIYHNPEEYLFDGVFEDNIDKEVVDENTETIGISYDSLMAEIMFFTDNPSALMNEMEKLSMNELRRIAEYYDLKKSRKKEELVESIVYFECSMGNVEAVFRRRKLWFFLNELKEDNYLNKYILIE